MEKVALSPNTFLWQKGIQGLLYNPESGAHLKFSIKNPWIESFCHTMKSPKNMYSCDVDLSSIDDETAKFLSRVVDLKLGKVVPKSHRIASFPPTPYVIHSVKRMLEEGIEKYNLLSYISSIAIYLGGGGNDNSWYLQTEYPFLSSSELTIQQVISLLSQLGTHNTRSITIVVAKEHDNRLVDIASNYSAKQLSFLFSVDSFHGNKMYIEQLMALNHNIALVVLPGEVEEISNNDLEFIKTHKCAVRFLINNLKVLETAESLADNHKLVNCSYLPIWDNNYDFFYDNVLLTEEEIFSGVKTKRALHCHQLLNINYWGKLNVFSNGDIYANPNEAPLGSINDTLYSIVEKELLNGSSWRAVRNYGKCRNCLYQWICPSPSSFELLSGHMACKDINM